METISDKSIVKVWIYRSIIKLNPVLETHILEKGRKFISEWSSHGTKLAADFEILHNHFLVFFVDELTASASGCSIDSSVGLMREIDTKFKLGLFDRMQIAFYRNNEIEFHHFHDLKDLQRNGKINDNDLVFNPLVGNKQEFENGFLLPFSQSIFYK